MKGYSILICCYNSEKRIVETLSALHRLERENIETEIIVVDNASTDATSVVAESFLKDKNVQFSIHSEELPGKTNAILRGIGVALYDKIVFCDDDVLLSRNYLVEAEKIFSQNEKIGLVGGKGFVSNELVTPHWFKYFENAYAVGQQWERSGDITIEKGYVWGAGSILRKEVWTKILEKGFSCFYTGFVGSEKHMAGEDSELCLWVIFAGFKIWYSDRLTYIHNLEQRRLNWNYLLAMNVGFARSQVYLDLLQTNMNTERFDFKEYRKSKLRELQKELFRNFFSINYFKSLWISYVENRAGYSITFKRNNTIVKIKELVQKKSELQLIAKEIKKTIFKLESTNN